MLKLFFLDCRRSVVNVEATVIEKTMSPMMLSFLMVKRRRVRRLKSEYDIGL